MCSLFSSAIQMLESSFHPQPVIQIVDRDNSSTCSFSILLLVLVLVLPLPPDARKTRYTHSRECASAHQDKSHVNYCSIL